MWFNAIDGAVPGLNAGRPSTNSQPLVVVDGGVSGTILEVLPPVRANSESSSTPVYSWPSVLNGRPALWRSAPNPAVSRAGCLRPLFVIE